MFSFQVHGAQTRGTTPIKQLRLTRPNLRPGRPVSRWRYSGARRGSARRRAAVRAQAGGPSTGCGRFLRACSQVLGRRQMHKPRSTKISNLLFVAENGRDLLPDTIVFKCSGQNVLQMRTLSRTRFTPARASFSCSSFQVRLEAPGSTARPGRVTQRRRQPRDHGETRRNCRLAPLIRGMEG